MNEFSPEKAAKEHARRQKDFKESDTRKILDKENNLFHKFLKNEHLNEYFDDFKDLFSLMKDYYKGNYREVPWKIISSVGGALLYVLFPLDLIPDFIPVVGFLDDAAVFAFCVKFVQEDLQKYRAWKENASPEQNLPS